MLAPQQQSNPPEDYLTLKPIDPLPSATPADSAPLTPSAALKVVQIGYFPKFSYPPKRSIIHDVNCFTKRRNRDSFKASQDEQNRSYKDENSQKSQAWAKVTREWGASRSGHNLEVLVPSPREQLDSLKTGLKSARKQNDEYLRQNNNIVKQKIRSKMLGEKHQPLNKDRQDSSQVDRFGKYNHALEQFMIRKKINKRKHQTIPDEASEESTDTIRLHQQEDLSQRSSVLLSAKRKGTLSLFRNLTLAQQNLPREPKLIIVSRLNPTTHRSVKLASQYQHNKTESRRQSGVSLLKRFICKHFPKASQSAQKSSTVSPEKSALEQLMGDGSLSKLTINQTPAPAHFIKLPFNCTLLKRQIKQLRKESVELPQLLSNIENDDIQKQQASLDAKINSKKFSTLFEPQAGKSSEKDEIRPQERSLPNKYVVYSKKNLHSASSTSK